MPLLKCDIIEGRTDEEISSLLDATHEVVLKAFRVPEGDRYQIVNEHRPSRTRIEDTGLGIPRTGKNVILQVISRPRSIDDKQTFHRLLCEALSDKCDISASDVMVTFVENTDPIGHSETVRPSS